MNPKSSKPILVCAFGLLAAFFMPWIQFFGIGMSGYNLGRLGSYGNYAWVIPILAGGTILLSFSGVNNRWIGAVTGIVPLGAILYALVRLAGEGGGNATQGVLEIGGNVLSIGAWLTIIFSMAIIIAAFVQVPADTSQSKGVESSTSSTFNTSASITARFDRAKWNALLQYDKDIALIADKLQPLGQKWLDELASSYLALNNKQYLPEIEHKILDAARREAEEKEQEAIAAAKAEAEEKEQLRIRAEEQQKAYEEQQKVYLQEQERRSQARKEQIELWRDRLTGNRNVLIITSGFIVFLIATVVIVALWQRNLKIKEEEVRLAEERRQVDEIRRRTEEEQAKGQARIAEMEKRSAEESRQMDEIRRRTEEEQARISRNPSSAALVTLVNPPPIKVGDSYIYESIDPDHPGSSITTKRTVTSKGDKITFSIINLNSINAKIRNLYFNHEWNLIGTRNADNSGFDYSPPLKYFDFPLYPGKAWQQTTTETNIKTGATRIHKISGTIGQWEDISVPAGVFHAIKVILQTELFDPTTVEKINGTDISWYVPEIRRSVKSLTTGKDGKKQLIQLIRYELK